AQNAADTGCGTLVWLDGARMVVRLDLESDRPSVGETQHAGVFSGSLDDLGTGGRKGPQHRLGMLVAAMLRPERGEDAELRQGRRASQQLEYAAILEVVEVMLSCHFGRDNPFPREGEGLEAPIDGESRHEACLGRRDRKVAKASASTRVKRAG